MQWMRHILLFGMGMLGVLLAGEAYLRIAGICERSDVEYVEGQGKMLRANHAMLRFSEGYAITHSNANRHLGPDRPKVKADHTIRIALLGDSFIEGYQVHDRHHLRQALELGLGNQLASKQVEVLNFGRSNFDLGNMYAYHQLYVQQFSPDLSLFFLSLDDLSIEYADPLLPSTYLDKEQLTLTSNTNSAYYQSFQRSSWLLKHSHVFYLLNKARHRARTVSPWTILTGKTTIPSHPQETAHSTEIPALSFRILDELTAPQSLIVWRDFRPPPEALIAWVEEHNRSLINLSPFLQELMDHGQDPYYWKATKKRGHWNQQAHQAIGEYLASKLLDFM